MKRSIVLVLDSFGVGASADAGQFVETLDDGSSFNDAGSNTLGHIAKACLEGKANINRHGPLRLPNLKRLGLAEVGRQSSGYQFCKQPYVISDNARYGYAKELSSAKDSASGHWEMMGTPVLFEWGYFKSRQSSFPQSLLDEIVKRAELPGYLGNCHASGTDILEQLGEEHIKTGKPIFYTSTDSIFQIACHEQSFGLERLYQLCQITRELVDEYHIGRVIARPFVGDKKGAFTRTTRRRDYSVSPPQPTLLDKMKAAKGEVVAIGKINDIFSGQGITQSIKAYGIDALFDATLKAFNEAQTDTVIFTNFVNFDADFGHRRDTAGYACALEYFDHRLPELINELGELDLLIITADHGCDPTWPGTNHTREHIPILSYSPSMQGGAFGMRDTFADVGQSLAVFHCLPALDYGRSFLK